ncbi:branched-chain amino acid ABC transporter substrate-binding protein [Rummeliibacillus suwonensis]|jgi:branched-chain amino acid transport system substrate-binding protein|uniref:branched-chain amino acid ABC transporter substrate-binding protein n=1 Tax=Rummeliibacillus suwonensis TaxID=1306154 RepID=UPI001AAFC0FC|nr:branched-chain amino acid ABC transporter substrate-binding protein [Rummeliibacillus suwonensis]MBO2537444.1 branched-chain amino acid ABC transporter substrate-binding protein [Rummeliibacillus suwonensis]
MKFKKSLTLLLSGALIAGVLAGCSSKSSDSSDGGSGGSGGKVIKIATQSPLSGGSAILGEALKLGAQLKLEEESKKFEKLGYKLQLEPYDDQGDPKKGVSNANVIGADKEIYGIIGHLNSGVTIPSSEVYEKYHVAMVSPAATAVEVTERGLKTVNRIVARDDFQGPAGAEYAVKELGAKTAFIIQDKTAYGQGLADEFKKAIESQGAKVVGYEGITVGEKDFNGVINKAKSQNPDVIYFGGLYAEGGLIIKQAREKGIDVPIMGGDGLDSSGLVDIAGDKVANTYITSVAGDSTKTESGKKFVEDYKAKFNKKAESYSVYGYDSMGVLLKGIEDAIKANGDKLPSKEKVAEAVRAVKDYKGALTEVSFDDKGDNTKAKVFLYKFDKASYPPALQGEVSQ